MTHRCSATGRTRCEHDRGGSGRPSSLRPKAGERPGPRESAPLGNLLSNQLPHLVTLSTLGTGGRMSSPYWNPQHPDQGGRPPQAGGWSYGGQPPGGPVPPPGPVGPVGPGPEPRPAGFGRRLTARLIDYVLAFITATAFFVIMILVVTVLTGNSEFTDAEGNLWAFLLIFGWGLLLFFYDWLYLIAWGRTIGKMIVGIKVVNAADGGRLGQGQVIGRSAVFCLPQSLPCVGHLFSLVESVTMLGDDRERALHDRAAGTLVVRTRV